MTLCTTPPIGIRPHGVPCGVALGGAESFESDAMAGEEEEEEADAVAVVVEAAGSSEVVLEVEVEVVETEDAVAAVGLAESAGSNRG